MKFFKVTLTAYTDETTDFVLIPKADEYDGDMPVFNEKTVVNTDEYKEFAKTHMPPISAAYKLYEIAETVGGLNYDTVLQLESDGKLVLLDENEYIISNIKPKGKKKKASPIKQYMPLIVIGGVAVLLLVVGSAVSDLLKNNNVPVQTSEIIETTEPDPIVAEVTQTAETVPPVTTSVPITTTTTVVAAETEWVMTEEAPEILSDIDVHFIDVGQGDCIYASLPNDVGVLIDSGSGSKADEVITYLQKLGVSDLEYVIATHPHEDHIGGMDSIINTFEIGCFIMPEIDENMIPTTNCYSNMLTALEESSVAVQYSELGLKYEINEDCSFEVISSMDQPDSLNNYSVVVKLTYGETSYLFTGDMERASEYAVLKTDYSVDSDVLKVAHHGSDTSSIQEFITAVSPEFAIISVGENNDYGHPSENVTARLKESGANIIRTDENGTVIIKSDGVDVWMEFPVEEQPITQTPVQPSGGGTTYTPGSFRISFNANGGEGEISPIVMTAGQKVSLPKEGVTREGYNFIGWTQSTSVKYPVYNFVMPESDAVLYALWEPKEYTVTYDSNGGLGLVVPYKAKVDSEIALPTEGLTNGDLVLTGWNTNRKAKSAIKKMFMPNQDITLYAVWAEPNSQAKITLMADGQESSFSYEIGKELNCRDDFGIVKDGYIVSGWTLYDGYGDIQQSFTVRGDTTLYAVWEPAIYIDITIDQSYLNKANVKVQVPLDMNGIAKYELPVVDTEKNHRKGYTYGWSTEKNGFIEFYGGETAEFEKPVTVYRVRNQYGGGNGTKQHPYIISNWEHIELMAKKGVSGYFEQIADIEMPTSYTHTSINIEKPDKADSNLMYNHFEYNGGGFKIMNLKSNGGLFNELYASRVKNLVIENAAIMGEESADKVGIVANSVRSEAFKSGDKTYMMNSSEIQNCKISESVLTVNGNAQYVGAVVGYGGNICNTYITNISINVEKTASATYVGGIAGSAGEISGCAITGINIEGKATKATDKANIVYIGGITASGAGFEMERKNGTFNYVGCNITNVAVRNAVFLNAQYIGGMIGISGGRENTPHVTRCYVANVVMNGECAGSLVGAEGGAAIAHTISFCIIDDTNKYPSIGLLAEEGSSTTVLGAQILQVPFDGLMVDGVTYILGDQWSRDSNLNDGYIFPTEIKNLLTK